MDMDSGGRVVFRYKSVRHGMWETHDKARSTLVSAHAYEIYNNVFSSTTSKWKGLDITASSGVVWGNTFTGPYTSPMGDGLQIERSKKRATVRWNDPADQNVAGQSGGVVSIRSDRTGKARNSSRLPALPGTTPPMEVRSVWSSLPAQITFSEQGLFQQRLNTEAWIYALYLSPPAAVGGRRAPLADDQYQ